MAHLRIVISKSFSSSRSRALILGTLVAGVASGCGEAADGNPPASPSGTTTTSETNVGTSPPVSSQSSVAPSTGSNNPNTGATGTTSGQPVAPTGGATGTTGVTSAVPSGTTNTDTSSPATSDGTSQTNTTTSTEGTDTGTEPGGTDTSDTDTGPTGSVVCPDFQLPAAQSLAYMNDRMPNPYEFKFMDLPNVTTKELWECRRREIRAMAQEYLYGHLPENVGQVTGSVSGGNISVSVQGSAGTASFTVNATGSGDILVIDFGAGAPKPQNSRTASLNGATMITHMRTAYGSTDVGTAMAAAWGVGRIIDVLEQNPDAGLDPKKVVTTGCSTNGKLAVISAVFEPRVALGVPVEAGACGTSAWRVSSEYGGSDSNNNCQDIEHLETNWLGTVADPFRSGLAINRLPLDQHEVLAIRAPAPLMIFNNERGWAWLCAKGNVAAAQGAHAIWSALGYPDNFGFAESSQSHNHCSFPAEHNAEVQAFYSKFLSGDQSANTAVMRWHQASDEQAKWFDWDMDVTLE